MGFFLINYDFKNCSSKYLEVSFEILWRHIQKGPISVSKVQPFVTKSIVAKRSISDIGSGPGSDLAFYFE